MSTYIETQPQNGFWRMENEHLSVRISEKRYWFEVVDKRTGMLWGHDPWYDTVGELVVQNLATRTKHICHLSDAEQKTISPISGIEKGFAIRFEHIVDNSTDRILIDNVSVECQLLLSENKAEIKAKVVSMKDLLGEWSLQEITFPCRFGWFKSLEDAYLLVPCQSGFILPGLGRFISRTGRHGKWADVRLALKYGDLHIPMFGVVNSGSGLLGIVDTPYDFLLEVMGNYNLGGRKLETTRVRLSSCYPTWRASRREFRYPREIRYQFVPEADYVKLAKLYREDAIKQGKFRSLDNKAQDVPALRKLFGAPCFEFVNVHNIQYAPDRPLIMSGEIYDGTREVVTTFEGVKRCLQICHDELGIEKAQVISYGINEGGPDVRYPDIFPINQDAGGEKKFRELCEYMQEIGYVGPMADTYIHTYLDSPSFDAENLILDHGRLRRYQSRRDQMIAGFISMEEYKKEPGPLKQWMGGTEHLHCGPIMLKFAQRNYPELLMKAPISGTYLDVITAWCLNECYDPNHLMSRQDDAYWRTELLKYVRSLGLVVESEWPEEYALHHMDISHLWIGDEVGVPIPLWQLIYHDALILKHFVGELMSYWGPSNADYVNSFLRALVYGDTIMILLQEENLKDAFYRKWLGSLCKVVHRIHGEVANQEMIDHTFLTEDHQVERSTFSSGTQVMVNFRMVSYLMENGQKIHPRGYHVVLSNGDTLEGYFGNLVEAPT